MRFRGAALLGLGALAVLGAIGADVVIRTSHHLPDRDVWVVLNAALGCSFVGVGLYAWWRWPANRTGALMTWVGFLFFLSTLEFSNSAGLATVGQFTDPLPIAGLAHLILAFPNGRLESRYQRGLIAAGYLTSTVLQLPAAVFADPTASCSACPDNLLLISSHPDLSNGFAAFVNLCAISIIALVAREVLSRVVRSHTVGRGSYNLATYAGLITLVAFACLFASHGFGGPGADWLRFIAFGLFVLVPFAFLGGLLRGQLSHAGAVGDLVASLGRADEQIPLQDLLSAALGDSSLTLAYWVGEQQVYVDAQGRPVELPAPGSGRVMTPIERAGEPIAVLIHDEWLTEEGDFVQAIGGAAALALENERLNAELRARIAELRASRSRIVQAGDEERRRLEHDLHDGAQQRLVALALQLRLARGSPEPDEMRGLIDEAIGELTEATSELRELARGIHPAILTERGLDAAVTALAGRAPVPVEVHADQGGRLAAPIESTAYFVVAEALTNVARYAQASHAEIAIGRDNGSLVVEVRDDGVGGADPGRGSGLRGLTDRVAAVDGRLLLTSEPGGGTVVHAEIPCAR